MSFFGPCEIFICHPILMGFFSLDSSQRELSAICQRIFLSLMVFEIIRVKDANNAIWLNIVSSILQSQKHYCVMHITVSKTLLCHT